MELEKRGIPTITFVGERFNVLANYERQALGMPELRLVLVEYPFGGTAPEVAQARGARAFDQVVAGLTGTAAAAESNRG